MNLKSQQISTQHTSSLSISQVFPISFSLLSSLCILFFPQVHFKSVKPPKIPCKTKLHLHEQIKTGSGSRVGTPLSYVACILLSFISLWKKWDKWAFVQMSAVAPQIASNLGVKVL